MHSIATFQGSKAKVIPSRSEQCDLDGTNELSPESYSSEEALHVVDGYFEKSDDHDSASISSESILRSFSGKSPAAELKLQPKGDGNSPSRVDVNEKFPLVDINQQDMGEAGDNVDMVAEYDQEERRAIVDNDDTSTDRIQEEKGVACGTANTSAEPVQGERVAIDDDADTSQDINQEDEMGLCGGTDTSVTVKEDDAGEAVDKADGSDVQSEGYKDTGIFCLWEVTQLLVEGRLDEDRMRRLKDGFLALLASLENATGALPVPASICSDAGGVGSKTLDAIEDSAQGRTKSDNFPEWDNSALDGEALREGGDARLEEASSAGREGGVAMTRG